MLNKQEKILSLVKLFYMWLSAPCRLIIRIGDASVPDQLSKDRAMQKIQIERPLLYKLMKTRNYVFRGFIYPVFTIVWFVVLMLSWFWPVIFGELYKNLLNWFSAKGL